jgi:hypothetical protein
MAYKCADAMLAECEKINAHITLDTSQVEKLNEMFKGACAHNQPIEVETQAAQITRVLRKQPGYEDMTEEKFNSLSNDERCFLYHIQQGILRQELDEQIKKDAVKSQPKN